MNDLRYRLANFCAKAMAGLRKFMVGRYGTDRLSTFMLVVALVFGLLSSFFAGPVGLTLWALSYLLMILAIFRCLSRNIARRHQENRRFLLMIDRVRDRQNRYFICPKCRQTVRVPRKKGKIAITCPKCRERFERRT